MPRRSFAPLYRLLVADLESDLGKESSQACRIDAALDNRSFVDVITQTLAHIRAPTKASR
jgi:hypothetical protein